jgi:lipid-A-disaccharide synthase
MKVYFVAGEASGDARGAELMNALRELAPDLQFLGAGGPRMREIAGGDFLDWADEAVVGLWDVLRKYGYFKAQFDRTLADLVRVQPDALIFIDYPGFNLRMAKAARARLSKTRIIYYISPQVWAWHRGRIPKMAKVLDLMLCIFPFEKPLYEKSGLRTEFVGHPLVDALEPKRSGKPREMDLIALLPGSRKKEVRKIFPTMLAAARLMKAERPGLQFAAAAPSEVIAEEMRALLPDKAFCSITVGAAHNLMDRAGAGMVCSGTATLEAAFFGLPMVILYRTAWLTWVVGRRLVKVPFLGMPNLLAGREIVREFLQDAAQPEQIAAELLRLTGDPEARIRVQKNLTSAVLQLGDSGAGTRAARAIVRELSLAGP